MLKSALGRLRLIGLLEGASLLVLLFIAMPMKYMAGQPAMVKYTGWAHGLLFVLFMLAVLMVFVQQKWPFKKLVYATVAAFLPFGTFVFDAKLKKEMKELSKP